MVSPLELLRQKAAQALPDYRGDVGGGPGMALEALRAGTAGGQPAPDEQGPSANLFQKYGIVGGLAVGGRDALPDYRGDVGGGPGMALEALRRYSPGGQPPPEAPPVNSGPVVTMPMPERKPPEGASGETVTMPIPRPQREDATLTMPMPQPSGERPQQAPGGQPAGMVEPPPQHGPMGVGQPAQPTGAAGGAGRPPPAMALPGPMGPASGQVEPPPQPQQAPPATAPAAASPLDRLRAKAAQAEPERMGVISSTLHGAAEGLLFEYPDEIEAGVRAAFTDDTYEEAKKKVDARYDTAIPGFRLAGNIAGAIAPALATGGTSLLGQGAARLGARAAPKATQAVQGMLAAPGVAGGAARTAAAGAEGAAHGFLAGTGAAEGGVGERLAGGAEGAAMGGVLGAAAQPLIRGGTQLAKKALGGGTKESAARLAAAEAAGVAPTAGMVAGGKGGISKIEGMTANVPGGGRIGEAWEAAEEQLGRATGRVVPDAPEVSPERAGRAVQDSVEGWKNRTQAESEALYAEVKRHFPNEAVIGLRNTMRVIDELVPSDPAFGGVAIDARIKRLAKGIRKEAQTHAGRRGADLSAPIITGGSQASDAFRLRSDIGSMLKNAGIASDLPTGELKRLYGALSQDIGDAAAGYGDEAVGAWRRAEGHWKQRQQTAKDFMEPLAKKPAPEAAFHALRAGGRKGATTLNVMREASTPEDWQSVQATTIHELGKARPGFQDSAGDRFSAGTWSTEWAKLPETSRKALFPEPGMRRELDNISDLASVMKENMRVMANPSGTAKNLIMYGVPASFIGTGGATIAPAIGGVLAANLTSRLLTNPRFVRWFARSTKIAPASPTSAAIWGRLGEMAASEEDPQMAAEMQQYAQATQPMMQDPMAALQNAPGLQPVPFTPMSADARANLAPMRQRDQLAQSRERARMASMRKQNPQRAERREYQRHVDSMAVAQAIDEPLAPEARSAEALQRLVSHPGGQEAAKQELRALPQAGKDILRYEMLQQLARRDDGTAKTQGEFLRSLRAGASRYGEFLQMLMGDRDYRALQRVANGSQERDEEGRFAGEIRRLFPRPELN